MLEGYQTLKNAQFELRFVEGERPLAQDALKVLSESLTIITGYFGLLEPFPQVRVVLVANRSEFDRLVRDLLHVEIEVPSNPARMAQPQRTDLVVLSPSAYETHCSWRFVKDEYERLLAHELVHIVEEYLTPDIEMTPRWWSEGLAVFLSQEWRHEERFRQAAVEAIALNRIPSFGQIEAESKLAYDWGWTIVRFLECVYGKGMIRRMVREGVEGRVLSVTGETLDDLERRWREWLLIDGCSTT